jgi:hypothetical protein
MAIGVLESKACTNCAKARRKCGKQRPHCIRCQTRGRTCHYPLSKPTSFVPLLDDASSTVSTTDMISTLPSPLSLCHPFLDDNVASWWFASPETWAIDPPSSQLVSVQRFVSTDFDRVLQKVMTWLTQWIESGSNPFIHRHLYRTCFPTPIQDAYTSLSTYLHRSPANSPIINRIIEDRVTKLVSQGLPGDSSSTNTLEVLPCVQALLIYQIIGLSSSDVRLRHLAEQHIPVLESWVCILMDRTSLSLASPPPESPTIPPGHLLWYTWIIAESVRRAWLITAGIQGLYKHFTHPDPTRPCMGGTVFTSRRGFWEAPSARLWEKECTERYAGLVRLTEIEKMFTMVPKEEINEFAKVVLECTFGGEWCEEEGLRA